MGLGRAADHVRVVVVGVIVVHFVTCGGSVKELNESEFVCVLELVCEVNRSNDVVVVRVVFQVFRMGFIWSPTQGV